MKKLQTKLHWEVMERQIFVENQLCPDRKALIRSDDGKILSIKSDRYRVFKNDQFQRLIDRLVALSGFRFVGFEEFQNGKRILGFLKNNNPNLRLCGHKVKDYLVVGNSHDGTSKMFIGTSNFLLRCENQFTEKIRSYELTHLHQMNFSDEELLELIGVYEHKRADYYQRMEELSLVPVSKEMVDQLLKNLLATEQRPVSNEQRGNSMSNRERMFRDSIHREIGALGNNLWGLFNGVTHFATHHIKTNAFMNSGGSALELNQKGLELCLEMFDEMTTYDAK